MIWNKNKLKSMLMDEIENKIQVVKGLKNKRNKN
jgi:hypothetical protein